MEQMKIKDVLLSPFVVPLFLIITTFVGIVASTLILIAGYDTVFQNIIFIPIILVCFFYLWRGFLYSCLVSLLYLLLVISISHGVESIESAIIRVAFFVIIAGVITFLAHNRIMSGKALVDIENRYHALFESMHKGFAYGKMLHDEQGKAVDFEYLKVNSAYEQLTGLSRVEGRRVSEIHHDLSKTYPELFGTYKRVSNTGIFEKIELSLKPSNTLLSVSVYCPQNGYFLGVYDNITGQRKTEEALRERKTRISQIVSRLPIPLCYVRSDNAIEFINTSFIQTFGYSHLELPSLYAFWERAFPDEMYRQWVRHTWQKAVKTAKETGSDIEPAEYTVTCSNGELRIIEISGITIEDHFIATFVDFTDRRHAEEAVREANQKLRFLTGITRHDIFNQLNAMYLYLDMAMDEEDSDLIHEYVSKVQGAGKRIEEITGFTREYEHFGTDSSGWHNVNHIIESAQTEIPKGIIEINSMVPEHLEVYADPIIRKVFTTLFDNAIRHGKEITEVGLSVQEGDSTLTILCEDDGGGICASEKELIFENGFGKNTGIGLFLSRKILAINGFSIEETGVEGEGARFDIQIPTGKFRFVKEVA